jgi:predicted permease
MEKVKYIVSRLFLIAVASFCAGLVIYCLGLVGKYFGLADEHTVALIIGSMAFALMTYWLAEDYELKKLKDK